MGYYALRRAVHGLAALPDDGGTAKDWVGAGAEARRGLMDIFGREDSTSNERLTPEDRRYAVAEAFRWSLIRASERAHGHRVVVAIDDLHSVDGASRNAFADALGEPPLIPALLVATYPAGLRSGVVGEPRRGARAHRAAGAGRREAPRGERRGERAVVHGLVARGSRRSTSSSSSASRASKAAARRRASPT